MKVQLFLNRQTSKHLKEIVQLTRRESLLSIPTLGRDSNLCPLLGSALNYAIDPNTRAWSMNQVALRYNCIIEANQLLALGGWRFLPWDSQVLGCPSGAVGGLWAEGNYAEQCHRLETVLTACIEDAEAHGVGFLSTRLPEGALAALHVVEAMGFRIIESFLTFSRETAGEIPFHGESDFQVRLAQLEEMETVGSIAYRAFQSFRLRVDPHIPESRARHSRREWVRNGFKGRAEAIYVAETESHRRSENSRLVGFVLLRSKTDTEKIAEIELIAVEPEFHGKGIGKALVARAIRHYQGKTSRIQVGTQAKNLRAIQLYTRMGFSIVRSELSFHQHSAGTPMSESSHSTETKDTHYLGVNSNWET